MQREGYVWKRGSDYFMMLYPHAPVQALHGRILEHFQTKEQLMKFIHDFNVKATMIEPPKYKGGILTGKAKIRVLGEVV